MKWFVLYRKDGTLYMIEFLEEELKTLEEARRKALEMIGKESGESIELIGVFSECISSGGAGEE